MIEAQSRNGKVFKYDNHKYSFESDGETITKYFKDDDALTKASFCKLVGIPIESITNQRILSNRAGCLTCGDVVYSAHRHDYSQCRCGRMAVDGGMAYLRRVGERDYMHEMSVTLDEELVDDICEVFEQGKEERKSPLGLLCKLVVLLEDEGYEIRLKED